jgi:AraC-like DNA-binding protein
MTIFAPMVGMLWRTIESYGVDPRRVISERMYQPGGDGRLAHRIPFDAYQEVVTRAAQLMGDPAAGLRAAEHLHPSHLGALGYAWMASSSLKTAIGRAQRFSRMYHEELEILVTEERDALKTEYRLRHHSPIPDLMADSHLACLLMMCRLNFGKSLRPAFVRMRRSPPPDPKLWHDSFGVVVQFDQVENSLAIGNQDAAKRLTGSNPMLVALHEDVIKRQIAELDESDIVNRASVAIMDQLPSGGVSEVSVAEALNMTTRTLHRRLDEKDLSFRALLTNLRKELADRYIGDPAYSMTGISFLLGYADTSAFSRAFKRWHGVSPTESRRGRDMKGGPSHE